MRSLVRASLAAIPAPIRLPLLGLTVGAAAWATFRKSSARLEDSAAAFVREGYPSIARRCDARGANSFETLLGGLRVLCMRGSAAAELFYGGENFTRVGAVPPPTQHLLQGKGTAPLLQGEAHARRKRMFMSFMTPASIGKLLAEVEVQWERALPGWASRGEIVLHDEIRPVLCRAAAVWIGIPAGEDLDARTVEAAAMVDDAAALGPRMVRALWLRRRTNVWARSLVERVRAGEPGVPDGSPLHVVATFRDDAGNYLPVAVAANEVINLLRPVIAVSRYIVYAAMALEEHGAVDLADTAAVERFAQEVRRLYPFFPAVGGRALKALSFEGHAIAPGDLVLFDLWGTNHDPALWPNPYEFRPERFLEHPPTEFDLVPQGGGDYMRDHRCPGEPIAVALIELAARFLLTKMSYAVPAQDLSIDLAKIPALPKSGFVVRVAPSTLLASQMA